MFSITRGLDVVKRCDCLDVKPNHTEEGTEKRYAKQVLRMMKQVIRANCLEETGGILNSKGWNELIYRSHF